MNQELQHLRLININYDFLRQVYLQECQRELLSQDQVLSGVGGEGEGPHLPVAHVKVLLENVVDQVILEALVQLLLQLLLHEVDGVNELPLVTHTQDDFGDLFSLPGLLIPSLEQL